MSQTWVTITIDNGVLPIPDISNWVIDVDTWKNKVTGIGKCTIRLDNDGDIWGAFFQSNNAIEIQVNGTTIWKGYVEDVKPYLDSKGVYTNEMIITGTDEGRRGADLYHTEKYEEQNMDEIISKILTALGAFTGTGSPWVFNDPGVTPDVKYECRRTYLGDAVREICELVGYDYYVDNDGELFVFPVGSRDSGVDLISDAGDINSNLLSFNEFEQVGGTIRNYIEISAGSLKDHWTEENGVADWLAAGAGAVVGDETAVQFTWGKGSIELSANGAISSAYLDFTAPGLYTYTLPDLSQSSQAKVYVKGERTGENNFTLRPYLVDDDGRRIIFTRRTDGSGSKGLTEEIIDWNVRNKWSIISFSLGDHDGNPIKLNQTNGYWNAEGVADARDNFDWTNVAIIGFEYPHVEVGTVWIDGLCIPSIDVRAVSQDAGSQIAFDWRMIHEYRKEIRSQVELQEYADRMRDLKKDPVQKFKAIALGQVGTLYQSQYVHVRAPQHGIFADTPYIIVRLHHIVHHNRDLRGWDFLTEYELIAVDTQAWRVDVDKYNALLAELRRQNRSYKGGLEDEDILLGDVETGSRIGFTEGNAFPTDPADQDMHKLTTDIANYYGDEGVWYRWNESTSIWERSPLVMHRAVQPPAGGGMVGDTWHDTTNDLWYECRAEDPDVWILIVISGASLKKGVQPFDSAILFEPIRAAATSVNTFAVDVNDVTDPGKARITGPNGTFSDFTVGDKLIIQNAEDSDNNTTARAVNTIDPANDAWIKLDGVLAGADTPTDEQIMVSAMNAIKWTNNGAQPEIWFADGDTQHINSGSAQTIAVGANWVYFTVANANLTVTPAYANAVGDTVAVICRLEIYADSEPLIFPFQSRGGNMSGDALAYGSVDTLILTSEEIYGKHFATAYNVGGGMGSPPGVRFDRTGIYGYTGGGVPMFYLRATDGSAYFLGGLAWMDNSALHIKHDGGAGRSSGIILYDNAGNPMGFLSVATNHIVLASDPDGYVVMSNWLGDSYVKIFDTGASHGQIEITTHNGKDILLIPSGQTRSFGSVVPSADHTKDLGEPARTWRYFNPVTTVAGRPAPVAGLVGLQWCTTQGGATDGIMWVCMRNDGGGYEWVELGRTA